MTVVLVNHGANHSLRIRVSGGYYERGSLLSGSITFMKRAVR